VSESPETSDFTSIQERIWAATEAIAATQNEVTSEFAIHPSAQPTDSPLDKLFSDRVIETEELAISSADPSFL